ncbi:hypothetical protein TR2A62_3587 [Thalassobium sp. R2A62]|nr:hypothetical protein TR2A62_3587 [Thalassobium sp. R2A62]
MIAPALEGFYGLAFLREVRRFELRARQPRRNIFGYHICRSIVYDVVFAISEDATLAGMLMNDHTSQQARKKYTGDRAKQAALAAAGKEIDDLFDAFGA